VRVQFETTAFVYMICSVGNCNGDGSECRHGEREGGKIEFGDRDQWRSSCTAYITAAHASPASVTAAFVLVTVASASR